MWPYLLLFPQTAIAYLLRQFAQPLTRLKRTIEASWGEIWSCQREWPPTEGYCTQHCVWVYARSRQMTMCGSQQCIMLSFFPGVCCVKEKCFFALGECVWLCYYMSSCLWTFFWCTWTILSLCCLSVSALWLNSCLTTKSYYIVGKNIYFIGTMQSKIVNLISHPEHLYALLFFSSSDSEK